MEVCRKSSGLLLLLGLSLLASTLQGVQAEAESEGPSESECRPYIEKALKELETGEPRGSSETDDSREDVPTVEITTDDSDRPGGEDDNDTDEDGNSKESAEEPATGQASEQENAEESEEAADEDKGSETKEETASEEQQDQPVEDQKEDDETTDDEEQSKEDSKEEHKPEEEDKESVEEQEAESKEKGEAGSNEDEAENKEGNEAESGEGESQEVTQAESKEEGKDDSEEGKDEAEESKEEGESKEGTASKEGPEESKEDEADTKEDDDDDSKESQAKDDSVEEEATQTEAADSKEDEDDTKEDSKEDTNADEEDSKADEADSKADEEDSKADEEDSKADDERGEADDDDGKTEEEDSKEGDKAESAKSAEDEQSIEKADDDTKSKEDDDDDSKEKAGESKEDSKEGEATESKEGDDKSGEKDDDGDDESDEAAESVPEEELSVDTEKPTELRPREHVEKLLKLDDESSETEKIINRVSEITLKELKKLYENAIKPLEVLYKYRDLSNRHFGDAEIFSKPLILFMGPWSGGKSSIINYLVNNEYNETSLKTGAEPSPAYFNILMYGEEPEVIDGTELAADFTFSGLQKFGQGLEERLRGVKLPNKLLEKVNIVEIPGILEVRKQVSRVFPFNDACQWFIDRADIIFLVYDPSKLDVGPETEAILDQLKGREPQTRIVLNKADQVKPEELMRVQGALIWNISPLMSSPQPPTMYTTSLWSRPYEPWAPVRLLQAQERAFLRDLRGAIDKRIENKIASARRFAVRVRNHAKMVDCYLTTYYNHKSVFGNRKQVADEIIEHPQDYHIYEGLSTLTNISRYDLPDPDVYKDFFKLNPLYDFQQLSATCTYFRGCPINRLDVAIAYDLPELVGTHKKLVENALAEAETQPTAAPGS